MKILVTGGAGFIGSHLVERLLEENNTVYAIDNFDDYYSKKDKLNNLKNAKKRKKFKFINGDIASDKKLKKVFENKIDVVVHLAAKSGIRTSVEKPENYYENNVLGLLNVLKSAQKYNVGKFIYASSSSVYGERNKVPFNEGDSADKPISAYAASKVAGEQLCYVFHSLYKMPIVCLRFFTVYGPRQRPDLVIRKFLELIVNGKKITVYGDGSSKRDYVYIDDIIDGIQGAFKLKRDFEIINLGNSRPIRLSTLIKLIEKNTGKKAKIIKAPYQPADVSVTYADITKAKKLLNWKPKVGINEGLSKMVEWYRDYEKQ